jgi:hypothetical protein
MNIIDIARTGDAVQRSLNLLRETYTADPSAGGGWYHNLGEPPPGATATAVALMAFDTAGEELVHLADCLQFLSSRQRRSTERSLDGGWATNTSLNRPVVEATGWVVQCIARLNCGMADGAPDLRRGYEWLLRNQNPDGGWGSFSGTSSRTWLTCLAIQALIQVNPYHEALAKGVHWLTESPRQVPHAWGKDPSSTPTVTHTAFVLRTLCVGGYARNDERVRKGYEWLAEHLDTGSLDEQHTRVEEPRTGVLPDGSGRIWRSPALFHYCLPIAAAAMEAAPLDIAAKMRSQLAAALDTIVTAQNEEGYWPNIYGSGITLWGVWPCVQALAGAAKMQFTGDGGLVSVLPHAVIIQPSQARYLPLPEAVADALPPRRQRFSFKRALRKYWAWSLLAAFVLGGLIGVDVKAIGFGEFGFGLIFPIILLIISLSYERFRPSGQ